MQSYKHVDYLGDAVLGIFAYFYNPEDPHGFVWVQNKNLAKIYDKIYGDRDPRDITKKRPGLKRLGPHGKGTWIEKILGDAFLEGGLKYAQDVFERMLRLIEIS